MPFKKGKISGRPHIFNYVYILRLKLYPRLPFLKEDLYDNVHV